LSLPNGADRPVAVSAVTGEGLDALVEAIEAKLARAAAS